MGVIRSYAKSAVGRARGSVRQWVRGRRAMVVSTTVVALMVAGFGSSMASASSNGGTLKPGETVTISIPGALRGSPPILMSVKVPRAGTVIGIDSPIHSDPGQGAMDSVDQRIANLLGAKSILEDANLSASAQVSIGDSMMSRGVKALITDVLFPNSMNAVFARAKSEHIPVCSEFTRSSGGAQENDSQAGKSMVAFLHRTFPKGAVGAALTNTPSGVILNRQSAFYSALAAYPGLKIIAKPINLEDTVSNSRTLASNVLTANPQIQFIWTTNDVEAIGAGLAAQALHRHIVIVGMNGSTEGVAAVRSGLITATWDSNQNAMGAMVAINCFNAIATGKLPPARIIPFVEISRQNISQWIPWSQRPVLTVVKKATT